MATPSRTARTTPCRRPSGARAIEVAAPFSASPTSCCGVEAKVMEAREAQAVAQILIDRLRNRAGLAVAEQLDEERIVRRRRKVGKVLIRVGPLVHDPEIELLDVPSFRGSEVRHAHGNVVALRRGERTLLVTSW